jgi:hypothetical protein
MGRVTGTIIGEEAIKRRRYLDLQEDGAGMGNGHGVQDHPVSTP